MAEPFSIVAGALSVAALFNNCVDCFEYIQLGRSFGHDYERCQLRLDIAKTRLGRWGEAVKINDDPRFNSGTNTISDRIESSCTHRECVLRVYDGLYVSIVREENVHNLGERADDSSTQYSMREDG